MGHSKQQGCQGRIAATWPVRSASARRVMVLCGSSTIIISVTLRSMEQNPNDRSGDQDQQDQLQHRPILPWYRQEPADLVNRPVPDELDKMENCGDSLLQKVQYLVENVVHDGCSAAVRYVSCLAIRDSRTSKRNATLSASASEPGQRVPHATRSRLSQVSARRTPNVGSAPKVPRRQTGASRKRPRW